jgi:hypothetical protein
MPFLGLVLVGLAYSPSEIFNRSIFMQLGDASYSLYLLRMPFWDWMSRADRHLGHWHTLSPKLFFCVYVAPVIAASLASLYLNEIPARLVIRRTLRRLSRQPLTESAWQPASAIRSRVQRPPKHDQDALAPRTGVDRRSARPRFVFQSLETRSSTDTVQSPYGAAPQRYCKVPCCGRRGLTDGLLAHVRTPGTSGGTAQLRFRLS